MALKNLVRGQYQIGDLIFGRGTNIRVEKFDVLPYDIAAQEMQYSRANQKNFGIDQLTPTTINISFGVLRNYIIPGAPNPTGITNSIFKDFPKVADLRREWRDTGLIRTWGQLKPLYVCGQNDGVTRIIWGRPGQFTYARPNPRNEWIECLGEFRCADTVCYNSKEMFIAVNALNNWQATIQGTGGDSETWIRVLFAGPMINPKMMIGNMPVELNYTIPANQIVEVSGYVGSRRIVNNLGINLSSKRAGETPYLDKFFIKPKDNLSVTLAATGTNSNSGAAIIFRDAYEVID